MNFSDFDAIIDARTPSEFAEDHVPGAISAPVLYDAERAEVGTLYKQVSPFEAKKLGGALVAKNVARHVEQLFGQKDKGWRPLIYCWRGGKRSGAMAHILREIGWDAQTLEGGYRAYRRWVVDALATVPAEIDFIVVHGPTGSGKSRFLAALGKAGAQVLDLEALAAHRGSVLGGLPGEPQPSQKWFESQLLAELEKFDRARPVLVEGESKKIGELQVPEALMARMRTSRCVTLETALATRVTLLLDEYRHFLAALGKAGAQVLDLEALAAHRGSVLGGLPGEPQPSQKWFESQLLAAVENFDRARPVFVEGESKKIGELQVPDALMARMRASRCITLETDLSTRVTLLLDEYRHFVADRAALEAQLDCLTALHGKERIAQWKALAAAGNWREFVTRLLIEHYDPAYRRSSMHNFEQLGAAQRVAIASADENAFARAAESLEREHAHL